MATKTKWRTMFVCVILLATKFNRVSASQEVLKNLSIKFMSVLNKCSEEMGVPGHVMQDFYNYWREEYELVNIEMGCVIVCMAAKFDLLTDDSKVHKGKAHEFAMSHGADEDLAKQLVGILHECENTHTALTDECARAFEIAKCFRTKIHEFKWAPAMETVLEEVMTAL